MLAKIGKHATRHARVLYSPRNSRSICSPATPWALNVGHSPVARLEEEVFFSADGDDLGGIVYWG